MRIRKCPNSEQKKLNMETWCVLVVCCGVVAIGCIKAEFPRVCFPNCWRCRAVNWKWHQCWPGDLNQKTRLAWGPSLREEKSLARWPSICCLFVIYLQSVLCFQRGLVGRKCRWRSPCILEFCMLNPVTIEQDRFMILIAVANICSLLPIQKSSWNGNGVKHPMIPWKDGSQLQSMFKMRCSLLMQTNVRFFIANSPLHDTIR